MDEIPSCKAVYLSTKFKFNMKHSNNRGITDNSQSNTIMYVDQHSACFGAGDD